MTTEYFARQMDRLSGLRFRPADLTTHWEALNDLPDAVLSAAVSRAQRTRVEFPTPVELRQDADLEHAPVAAPAEDRSTPLDQPFTVVVPEVGTIVSVVREWKYYCGQCNDGGWESVWCGDSPAKPWQASCGCNRRGDHEAHEFVRPCACWDTNPALVRKREAQRQYAEQPDQGRKRR